MTGKRSAGLLLYRRGESGLEVLLAHMGGPLWARRDAGAWTVPKGEYAPPEEPMDAARREFQEELGLPPPAGRYVPLEEIRQANGKVVTVWAVESDLDPERIVPGTFEMEWPRGSGVTRSFPEINRVAWFPLEGVGDRLIKGQRVFLERLADRLAREG